MHRFSDDEMKEWAALYALGALSQHEARAFEEHLEGCAACAAELADFRATACALAFGTGEAQPSARAREQLLALVGADASLSAAEPRDDSTAPPLITLRADEGSWYKVGEGMMVKQLFVDPETKMVTSLVRMEPGAGIPLHRHRGIEQCYVIEGDFHADGKQLGPGDFHCAPKDSIHTPVYTKTGALVLIIAPQSYEVL